MSRRFSHTEARTAGQRGGQRSGEARRQKAFERIVGPLEQELRRMLFGIRADLTMEDVKPMRSLLGKAVRAGYKVGLGTGWRRADRAVEQARKATAA